MQKTVTRKRKQISKASRAARKAWATRRERQAVGFYDDKGKTKPITKSLKELKRKKVLKKPRNFKGVSPKGLTPAQKAARTRKRNREQLAKEQTEHPSLPPKTVKQIVKDHNKAENLKKIMEDAKAQVTKKPATSVIKKAVSTAKLKASEKNAILKQGSAKYYKLPPLKTWTRRSKSNPNKIYTQRLNQDGALSCDCPGWRFSAYPKGCSHVREVAQETGLGLYKKTASKPKKK